jgi:hypothetical protein
MDDFKSIDDVRAEMWRRRELRDKPKNIVPLPTRLHQVSDDELVKLLENENQEQIGKRFGVTQAAVSLSLRRRGLKLVALRRKYG